MAVTINTNIASFVAQRNLNKAQGSLGAAMERLSSGLRINRAKDDAAGLAISKLMEKQVAGLNQGSRNANDGISLIQTTENAMEMIGNNLQRMRELAVQASTETYTAANRSALQLEFAALRSEIDRLGSTAEFNGIKLANGSNSTVSIQVGPDNTSLNRLSVSLTSATASALGVSSGATLTSAAGAQTALDLLDTAIDTVSDTRAQLGADQARLETAIQGNTSRADSLTAANSRIKDADFAAEVSSMSRANILTQAGTAMVSQANSLPQIALQLLG